MEGVSQCSQTQLEHTVSAMGGPLSAQDNRRLGRAVVCGALLVYGCLRIPAAAQPVEPQEQALRQLQESVRHLEARQQQIPDGLEELRK
jgi:outer membrane murein-binding lipoprotein Lpp